jgi:hypothetical protein
MSTRSQTPTATGIRQMAEQHGVAYVRTESDRLAHHITRLTGDHVELDEVEQMLIALQRAGHVSRAELLTLQASYLREAKQRRSTRSAISRSAAICATSPKKAAAILSDGLSIRLLSRDLIRHLQSWGTRRPSHTSMRQSDDRQRCPVVASIAVAAVNRGGGRSGHGRRAHGMRSLAYERCRRLTD